MLKAPNWNKTAYPSTKGWHDKRTGELILARKHSQADVDAWNQTLVIETKGNVSMTTTQPNSPITLTESPTNSNEFMLEHMTKVELEELGRENGIELDRRLNKQTLIEQLKTHLG